MFRLETQVLEAMKEAKQEVSWILVNFPTPFKTPPALACLLLVTKWAWKS